MICWQELFWWKNTTTFPFWNVNQWLILVKKKKTDGKKFGLEVYCMVGGISWASSSLWPRRIYLQFLDEISTETDGVKWMKTPSPFVVYYQTTPPLRLKIHSICTNLNIFDFSSSPLTIIQILLPISTVLSALYFIPSNSLQARDAYASENWNVLQISPTWDTELHRCPLIHIKAVYNFSVNAE